MHIQPDLYYTVITIRISSIIVLSELLECSKHKSQQSTCHGLSLRSPVLEQLSNTTPFFPCSVLLTLPQLCFQIPYSGTIQPVTHMAHASLTGKYICTSLTATPVSFYSSAFSCFHCLVHHITPQVIPSPPTNLENFTFTKGFVNTSDTLSSVEMYFGTSTLSVTSSLLL